MSVTSIVTGNCGSTLSSSDGEKGFVLQIYGKGTGTIINKSDGNCEIILCSEESDEVCVTLTKPVNSNVLTADLHNKKVKVKGDPLRYDANGNILLKVASIGTFENVEVILKNVVVE